MPDVEGLPWPRGDPHALRRAASRARTYADQLDTPVPELTTVSGGDSFWQGFARQRFDGTSTLLAREAVDGGGSLRGASAALSLLATTVDREQEVVRELARQLGTARAASREAGDTARRARHVEALHAVGPLPTEEQGNPQLDLAAIQAAADASAAERRCTAEAEAACARVDAADRRTATTLDNLLTGGSPLLAPGSLPFGLASGSSPSWLDHMGAFLLGDVANFWTGGEDGFPWGAGAVGALRRWRVSQWLLMGRTLDLFPTFNTGLFGRGLGTASTWASRFRGLGRLSRVAPWLRGPAATGIFRRVGIVGGAISTFVDVRHVIDQGNPIEAYEREGAGYVADVAQAGFSTSTTAFFVAPNWVTGGAVLVTGTVWMGAEIVDHREEISYWILDRWEDANAAWDVSTDIVGEGWDATTDFAGDAWSAGTSVASDGWDATGDALSAGGDLLSDGAGVVADGAGSAAEGADDAWDAAWDAVF